MSRKNWSIIIGISLSLILIVVKSVSINNRYDNKADIEQSSSLVDKQYEAEGDFDIDGFTLEKPNVILNPYGSSPLTALVLFQTDEPESPEITIAGKDDLTTIKSESKEARDHYIPIYGLYAGKYNKVIITIGNKTKELSIKTRDLPNDFDLPTDVVANDRSKLTDELYFFTPSSKGYTSAYDVNGDVRWYLTESMSWDISRLNNGRMMLSTERSINPPYFTTGLYELDLLGKIYNEYSLPGGYHHDYFEMEDGNLLVSSNDFDNEDGTVEDYIVELNRGTGDIVKEWDLKKVLNMTDGKSENWSEYDWFHNNSIWYDKKTNEIVLSGRHQDAILAIDYDSGKPNWIIGDPTNWSDEYQHLFFEPVNDKDFEWQWSQHAAMVTPEGDIFVLDNGNNKSKIKEDYVCADESYTRGVMYEIDRDNMTIEQVWQYGKERGSDFYSPYISDVDYIAENNYIVHSGGIVSVDGKPSNRPAGLDKNAELHSTTVELLDDQVIFEMTLPNNMYRTEKMSLYNDTSFKMGKADLLGTLGETKPTKEGFNVPKGAVEIDDDYESHNITLVNEEDRLVVNGMFKNDEEVNIMLYNNFNLKEYSVVVSKTPYTALCLDIFTQAEDGNKLEINKYINKKGLTEDYSIYIEIDNTIYNTGKTMNFND